MKDDFDLTKIFKKKFKFKGFLTLIRQLNKQELIICYSLMTHDMELNDKEGLIDFYLENYDGLLYDILSSFSSDVLEIIFRIVDNDGEMECTDIDAEYILLFKMFLIAFPVIKDNKNTLIIANEICDSLKMINREALYKEIAINDIIVQYTRGILACYGKFEASLVFKYIKEYENQNLNLDDYYLLLNNDSLIDGYEIKNAIIYSYQITEIINFLETRDKYQDLDYYHLTKEEILNGFDVTPEENELINFYCDQLEMPLSLAQQGLGILQDTIQLEMPLSALKMLLKQFDISTYESKQLEKLVERIALSSRLWSLKGHTKNEISRPKMIKFPTKIR